MAGEVPFEPPRLPTHENADAQGHGELYAYLVTNTSNYEQSNGNSITIAKPQPIADWDAYRNEHPSRIPVTDSKPPANARAARDWWRRLLDIVHARG